MNLMISKNVPVEHNYNLCVKCFVERTIKNENSVY